MAMELSELVEQLRNLLAGANDTVRRCLEDGMINGIETVEDIFYISNPINRWRDGVRRTGEELWTEEASWTEEAVEQVAYAIHAAGIDPSAFWRMATVVKSMQDLALCCGLGPIEPSLEGVVELAEAIYTESKAVGLTLVLAERKLEAETGQAPPMDDRSKEARRGGKRGRPEGPANAERDARIVELKTNNPGWTWKQIAREVSKTPRWEVTVDAAMKAYQREKKRRDKAHAKSDIKDK